MRAIGVHGETTRNIAGSYESLPRPVRDLSQHCEDLTQGFSFINVPFSSNNEEQGGLFSLSHTGNY